MTDAATKCPHCGALNEPGSKFCEACGEVDLGRASTRRCDLMRAPVGATSRARRRQPDQRGDGQAGRDRRAGRRPACAVPAVRRGGRRRRLLHPVRHQGARARATTSRSSPRPGWRASATAGSGTTATRTPWRWRSTGPRVVLVVCDGVSNTVDSDVGVDGRGPAPCSTCCARRCPRGSGVPESRRRGDHQGVHRRGRRRAARDASAPCPTTSPTRRRARSSPPCSEDGVVHYCGHRRLARLPAARRRRRADPHRRRLDGPGADHGRYAAGGGRGVQAGALDHQVAGQGQRRHRAAGRSGRGDRARAGCWPAPTACGTTPPSRRRSRRRSRRPGPTTRCVIATAPRRVRQRLRRAGQHRRRAGAGRRNRWSRRTRLLDQRRRTVVGNECCSRRRGVPWLSSARASTRTSSCPTAGPTCTRS